MNLLDKTKGKKMRNLDLICFEAKKNLRELEEKFETNGYKLTSKKRSEMLLEFIDTIIERELK